MASIPILKSLLGRRIGFSSRTPSTASDLIVEGGLQLNNFSGSPQRVTATAQAPTASPPANPGGGQLWYDTTAHVLKFWNGTSWLTITAA